MDSEGRRPLTEMKLWGFFSRPWAFTQSTGTAKADILSTDQTLRTGTMRMHKREPRESSYRRIKRRRSELGWRPSTGDLAVAQMKPPQSIRSISTDQLTLMSRAHDDSIRPVSAVRRVWGGKGDGTAAGRLAVRPDDPLAIYHLYYSTDKNNKFKNHY